jgi:hypothetical protein
MNNIEENIIMPTNNNIELLFQMGSARNNMAVVEPVAIPIPYEPPDTVIRFYFQKDL